MRKVCACLGLVFLAACSHGNEDKEAVRKAIVDRLAGLGMPPSQVTVKLNSVDFKGNSAVANVAVIPAGQDANAGMQLPYQLQYRENKWVVTGRVDSGHGPASGSNTADPHGGAVPAAAMPQGSESRMPSPDDLPPTARKPGKQQ